VRGGGVSEGPSSALSQGTRTSKVSKAGAGSLSGFGRKDADGVDAGTTSIIFEVELGKFASITAGAICGDMTASVTSERLSAGPCRMRDIHLSEGFADSTTGFESFPSNSEAHCKRS
jgi:hypothetical protein